MGYKLRERPAQLLHPEPHPRVRGDLREEPEEENGASETQPRAGQKLSGVDVPKCRFRFYKYVLLLIEGVIKFVMRRGKELVPTAVVSTGNDENEYGKAVVPRTMPFTSSSSDVLQATIRCNADYQYQKRGVPDLSATEQEAAAASSAQTAADQARFLMFGCRRTAGKMMGFLMTTLATAMRAAHVADFYMTKYLSKAQESLGSVMQPFIAGMRRTEDWEIPFGLPFVLSARPAPPPPPIHTHK